MANDAKKISELSVVTTLSANDRVVILANPANSANARTITTANFANSLILSNIMPYANTTQAGVIKVDGTSITISNGVISGASVFDQQLNTTNSVTFVTVNTSKIASQNSIRVSVGGNTYSWNFQSNGMLAAGGNIIPTANDTYTLGNSSFRWNSLWVGGNSVIFADTNSSYPDQVLTVSNGVFNITQNGIASQAGLRVGNFTFINQAILLANTYANIEIGTVGAVAPINFNRPINVRSTTGAWDTFSVDTEGRVDVISDIAENPIQAAFSVTSSRTRTISYPNNPGVLMQLSGSSVSPSRFYNDSYGNGNYSAFIGRHARGPSETPTQTLAGDTIARFGANPYGSNGFASISTSRVDLVNRQDQTSNNKGSEIQFWTTANNSNTIVKRMTVNEDGLTFNDNTKQNTAFSSSSAVTKINVGTGLTQSANVGVIGLDATGVLSVSGTANQVIVANVGQNVTLSLPQSIGTTSNVQFSTITVQNLVVTGNSTIANSASVANAVIQLAYNSTNAAQIDTGGFTLGNTSSSYYVGIRYNLSNNAWTTGNTHLITKNISSNTITAANGNFTGQLHAGAAYTGYDYPNATIQADSSINNYNQIVQQNHNNGTQASTDFVVVNDIGTDVANYVDLGINSSTYANNEYSISGPNDGYLYINGGDLAIGTQTVAKGLKFFAGGTASTNKIGSANSSGWFFDNLSISNSIVGYISNAQLDSSLANYQTLTGLSANVAKLSANNAFYLNGVAAASYTNTSGNYTITGVRTHSANIIIGSTASINANGSVGSTGQVLTSNGSSVYWSTLSASVNTSAQYNWTNTHTFSNTITFTSEINVHNLLANGIYGANGQVLVANSVDGMYWSDLKTHKAKKVKHKDGSYDPEIDATVLQDSMTFIDGAGIVMVSNTVNQTITIHEQFTTRDAGNINSITVDFANDDLVIYNEGGAASTIGFTNYTSGRKVTVLVKSTGNKAITHGLTANQANFGATTIAPPSSGVLVRLQYFCTNTSIAGVYVTN